MRRYLFLAASALTIGLAMPAQAQQSANFHRHALFFKYSDTAIKAMTENPQDRVSQAVKLYEAFGGKMETFYVFPMGGEYDGLVIGQVPDDIALKAMTLQVQSSGNFVRLQAIPLMTSDEFKAAMEKAKSTNPTYRVPTATRE